MIIILTAISALAAGILLTWIIRKLIFERDYIAASEHKILTEKFRELTTEKILAEERIKHLAQEKGEMTRLLEIKTNESYNALKQIAALQEKLENKSFLYDQQKKDLQEMTERLKKDFSLLANDILDEKTKNFNQTQQKELTTLLDPLKSNLNEFKLQVEKTYKVESDDRVSLREQVKHMMTLNDTLAKEAKALTTALTGNTKKQGDWGELILESILEYSGLQKGIHYFPQETSLNEDGNKIRPDVLVRYPDNRAIVIDSKVSLVHYDLLCKEEVEELQAAHLRNLLQSIRNHIDGLSNKNYSQITNALDMVIMFLPVEAAYITALQNDPDLQQYAYKKNVLLISPANLTIAMKLIYDMWKKDAINKNAEAVAEKAGKLYDKLVGFVDNFERVGRALVTLQTAYNDAHKQLTSGKGNIVVQAEQMKQLEIKASKQMPGKYLNEASTQDQLYASENEGIIKE